jgi:hypothetical protein
MTRVSLYRLLIQKLDDGVLAEVHLEALYLNVNVIRRKPLLDFHPSQLRGVDT